MLKPERTKATFYFHATTLSKFERLYAALILAGEKKTKTALLEEALLLLEQQYEVEWLNEDQA